MENEEKKAIFNCIQFTWGFIPAIIIGGIFIAKITKEYYPDNIKEYQEAKINEQGTYYLDVTRDGIPDRVIFYGQKIEVYKGVGKGNFDTENISNCVNLPRENNLEKKSRESI